MAVDDIVSLRVVGRYQAQNIVNTFHYQIGDQGESEQAVLQSLLLAWISTVQTVWIAAHSTVYELVGIKGFNHTGAAKTPAFTAIGENGGRSGTPCPSLVCRTITLYTASAKHRRRGRAMLSGSITEDFNVADGSVNAGGRGVMDNLGTKLDDTMINGAEAFIPCIPPTAVDPVEAIIDFKSRVTPSSVTTRRIRQFLIG